jgi:hypothetical protein
MFDKETTNQISALWRDSKSVTLTPAARLEAMIAAFQLAMRVIIDDIESVQKFWDTSGIIDSVATATSGNAVDAGGTVTKESVLEFQVLFLAFRQWLSADVEATVGESTVTLEKTPTELIMQQPEKAS